MIAILIVGYKSKIDLKECLGSIFRSSYLNFRVFFIDNSADGSVEYIKANFPKVEIISNDKNLGYAGGNNKLFKQAIKQKADYVFVLNPDTIIDRNCLKTLAEKKKKDTILQPLILLNQNGKNSNLVNTTGGHLNFLGFSYCSDYRLNKKVAKEKEIAIASGAAVFIPVNILKTIGLFDELFFMYQEDVDLFWRARLFGYNIRLIPDAVVWHKYSFSKHKSKLYYAERNRIRFLLKNFSLKYLILTLPVFLVNEVLILIYSILTGWAKEKILGWYEIVRSLPQINSERRTLKKLRKMSDSDIKNFISPSLHFAEFPNPLFKVYNTFLTAWWYLIYLFI